MPTVLAVSIAAFLIGPRSAPFLAVLFVLGLLLASRGLDVSTALMRVPAPMLAMLGLAGWALLAVLWSVEPSTAIGKVLLLLLFCIGVGTALAAGSHLPEETLRILARGCLAAFALGLGFLCFEELTGHAVKRLLYGLLPFIRPSAKHVAATVPDGIGEVHSVAAYLTNRNMAALTLALWPMMLLAWCLVDDARRWLVASAILAVAAVTIAISQHDTSVVALVASTACLALYRLRPGFARAGIAAGWLVATLLVVPITDLGFRTLHLHEATWLPHTARQRVILWGYTAQQVKARPLLGVGTDSTKPLDARRGPRVETPAGYVYQLRTGPHAHNIYLQTWYELGAVGAILLCAFGLALLRSLGRLGEPAQALMHAAFVSAAITAAFSWGMWQAWFMGAFAFSAMLGALAVEVQRRGADG